MTRKQFGTDGIRGKVGIYPLTPGGVVDFARALSGWLTDQPLPNGQSAHLVITGGDTRSSTSWILGVLNASLVANGLNVRPLNTVTTPAVAYETRFGTASAGVMVTASHNKAADNGLKLFGADGFKLADADEAKIEALMSTAASASAPADRLGSASELWQAQRYFTDLSADARGTLQGVSLVIDAAHGAASYTAGEVFRQAGADIHLIGAEPDGLNINDGLGATHPEALAAKVVETGAYAGVALDGDADRLIMCDETGAVVDGDQLIALLASAMHATGTLTGGAVAATVMSNLGLERHLTGLDIELLRAPVGDRHVVAAMRERGLNLGGEQSGHIVLLGHGTTGDGLLAALHVLAIAAADGGKFSEISRVFDPVPQKLVNVRFDGENPLDNDNVTAAIAAVSERLGNKGRVLVRKSGTEPLIRIMAEAVDPSTLEAAIAELERAVQEVIQSD
ncbi:MAG: phosphoglucosamine mutase [Pseudomonadota bacterium]